MYLIDTDVISELREKGNANPGVVAFLKQAAASDSALYLSAVTIGELRRGVELIRYRGDARQAQRLERWLTALLADYSDNILAFDEDVAQIWGRLRVPHPENPLDSTLPSCFPATENGGHGNPPASKSIPLYGAPSNESRSS